MPGYIILIFIKLKFDQFFEFLKGAISIPGWC